MTTKDIVIIRNCCRKTAKEFLDKIKMQLNKPEHHDVTIFDYSLYTGVSIDNIRPYLF